MNTKELLAQATKKLEAHKPTPVVVAEPASMPVPRSDVSAIVVAEAKRSRRVENKSKEGLTQKKGITLRPANLEKLDELELLLRKQGIKANHSGLIQLAIEKLQTGPELAAAYRELLKLDLRFK